MLAKFGLILLVLIATALAFLAGTLLPGESAAPPDPAATPAVVGSKPGADGKAPAPAKGAAGDADKPAADTIPYASLALPNVLPPKAQFGLQIGLYLDRIQTEAPMARLQALGQPGLVLTISDPNQAQWSLLAAGPYTTLGEAERQQLAIRRGLQLGYTPALLLLPPPKPAKAAAKPPAEG